MTKVLAVGSALGSFKSLVEKVRAIDAKHGKFEILLCTGDFFGPPNVEGKSDAELDQLLEGQIEIPFSTYVTQGQHPIPDKALVKASLNNGEICPNLFLLSKSGIITTAQKLSIATFGGKFDVGSTADLSLPACNSSTAYFNAANLSTFLSSTALPSSKPAEQTLASAKSSTTTSQIDILLTHQWPTAITRSSKTSPLSDISTFTAPLIDEVVKASKPRYHFASGGGSPPVFWEREPFGWDESLTTRFFNLGAFGGETPDPTQKKQRWFYAFSIAPITAESPAPPKPANATASPFATIQASRGAKRLQDDDENGGNFIFGDVQQPKRARLVDQKAAFNQQGGAQANSEPLQKPHEGYVCRKCGSTEHYIRDCPERNATGDTGGKKPPKGYICRACGSEAHLIQDCPSSNARARGPREPVKEIGPGECWFCLSNPNLTKHLIVSIGTEVYVTLPKGQLPPTDSSPSPTQIPGGGHVLLIPISHFPTLRSIPPSQSPPIFAELDTYKTALRAFYNRYGAVPVFTEVSRMSGKGGHAHVQCFPIPANKADGLENAFRTYGGGQVLWEGEESISQILNGDGDDNYFRVDLPDGKKMVHIMRPGRMFNLQFGREALAQYLGLEHRADWKECPQTDEEEQTDAQAFKEAFAELDPSM